MINKNRFLRRLSNVIFLSRWLQAPLYLGLIIVLGVYVYEFVLNLSHLIANLNSLNDTQVMLDVLDLIDVVMIANLLIIVVIGGYENFVSHLNLRDHPDHPEWLDEVNAGTMKVKLAIALISISSIHLLRTFLDPTIKSNSVVMWQVIIHVTLLISTIAITFSNYMITPKNARKVKSITRI